MAVPGLKWQMSTSVSSDRHRVKQTVRQFGMWLFLIAFCWFGTAFGLRWLAIRNADQGRVTRARHLLEWSRRLSWNDTRSNSLVAECARRKNDVDNWSKFMNDWTAIASSSREVKIERELMRVQNGEFAPNPQAQLNQLVDAGTGYDSVADAFVRGFLARQDLEQAMRVLNAWELNGTRTAEVRIHQAKIARMKGDFDESRSLLEDALNRCPHHELAHELLGELLLELRLPRAAAHHYLEVIREDSESISGRVGLAHCLRQCADWDGARLVIRGAVASQNCPSAIIQELGEIELESGSYEASVAAFRRASSHLERNSEGRMAAATAFVLSGDRTEADRLIAIDASQKSLKKQLRDIQIQIRLNPTNFEAQRSLERIREQLQMAR